MVVITESLIHTDSFRRDRLLVRMSEMLRVIRVVMCVAQGADATRLGWRHYILLHRWGGRRICMRRPRLYV